MAYCALLPLGFDPDHCENGDNDVSGVDPDQDDCNGDGDNNDIVCVDNNEICQLFLKVSKLDSFGVTLGQHKKCF